MNNKRILLLIALITGSPLWDSATVAYAFNNQRCISKYDFMSNQGEAFFATTTRPTDVSSTSSQFTSSWGECSALGMREQREVFIASNADQLMIDSARGGGEYLEALADLSGCHDGPARKQFYSAMQKNFEAVYLNRSDSPDAIGKRIDKVILSQPELKRMCKISS